MFNTDNRTGSSIIFNEKLGVIYAFEIENFDDVEDMHCKCLCKWARLNKGLVSFKAEKKGSKFIVKDSDDFILGKYEYMSEAQERADELNEESNREVMQDNNHNPK